VAAGKAHVVQRLIVARQLLGKSSAELR